MPVRQGLARKITVLLSTVLLSVMAAFSVADYLWERRILMDNLYEHLREEAWLVAAFLDGLPPTAVEPTDLQRLTAALDRGDRGGRVHEVFLLDAEGRVIAGTLDTMVGESMATADTRRLLEGQAGYINGKMEHQGHVSYFAMVPLYDEMGNVVAAVHVAEPADMVGRYLGVFARERLLMVLVTAFLLGSLANWVVTRSVVAPLQRLSEGISRVHAGDLHTRLEVPDDSELGHIARVFNEMVETVRKGQEALQAERDRLHFLYSINKRLLATDDWDEVKRLLVDTACQLTGVSRCAFLSYDDRRERLALEVAYGLSDEEVRLLQEALDSPRGTRVCLACRPRELKLGRSCPLLSAFPKPTPYLLCVHLAFGRQTVGFLILFLEDATRVSSDTIELLHSLAGEVAAVLAAIQARTRELSILSVMEEATRSAFKVEDALARPLGQLVEVVSASAGGIFLVDDWGHLRAAAQSGLTAEEVETLRGWAEGAVREGRVIAQVEEEAALERIGQNNQAVHAVYAFPFLQEDRALGALVLAYAKPWRLSSRQVALLSAIAAQMALVVRNSQLVAALHSQAILEERARLAREIHDGFLQTLGYVKLQLHRATRWAAAGEHQRLQEELERLRDAVEEAYADARDAIIGLRAGIDGNVSPEALLRDYVQTFSVRYRLPVDWVVSGKKVPLSPVVTLHLLRILQEALSNVRKHAEATRVRVELRYETDAVVMMVTDNGKGLELTDGLAARSGGLRFMKERAESLGGTLQVTRRVPQGTCVQVRIPITLARAEISGR